MAPGEQGLLVSVFLMHHPHISLGLRQKLLVRFYPSIWGVLNLVIPSCYSPLFLHRRLGRWGQAASKDTITARVAARSLAGGEDSRRAMVSWASQKGSEDSSCSYRIFPAFTWGGGVVDIVIGCDRLAQSVVLEAPCQAGRALALSDLLSA